MPVPVPFSPACVGLLLGLPGVWLLARELTRRFTLDLGLRAVVPVGLALALWLAAVHLCSLAAGSLLVGLPAGTVGLALAGGLAEVARRRGPPGPAPTGRPPSPWMWLTAAASAAAIAPMAFRFHFHDELLLTGHMSIAAELQNGIYPPRHLGFPDTPLRYHYGFDLLTACLTALFRLQIDRAIDVGTVLLWAASWSLLWALGERLVGRRRAWLTPFVTLFAGGIPLGCPPPGSSVRPSLLPNLVTECRHGDWVVSPPLVSYFFQHPWAVGIPVAVTAMLVFSERAPSHERGRYALLAGLLAVLSFGEMALFVTLLPSMMAAELYREGRLEPRRLPAALLVCAAALGGAKGMGGFLVASPGLAPMRFLLHPGFAETWGETRMWNEKTFGVFWLLGPLGLLALRRDRLLLGLLAAGSLVVVNAVRYEATGDVIKFATVALFGLGILGSVALARLLATAPGASPARPALAVGLFVPATAAGCLYVLAYLLDVADLPAGRRTKPAALTADDLDATGFLRRRLAPGELVYRFGRQSPGYAQWAGLPLPWTDWATAAFGFSVARVAEREQLLNTMPRGVAPYRAQGFRFFVLDDALPEDEPLFERTNGWILAGYARIAATFGGLVVVELTTAAPAPPGAPPPR